MKTIGLNYQLRIDQDKCDKCAAKKKPLCTEVCPYDAIYPDVNSNYIWADCDLSKGPELCRKCVESCPHQAIQIKAVPPAKIKEEEIAHFETPGIQNTPHVIEAIRKRLTSNSDIRTIVVASCSGSSALLLAEALKCLELEIINISAPEQALRQMGWQPLTEKMAKRLSELGITCREQCFSNIEDWASGNPNFGEKSVLYDPQLKKEYQVKYIEKILNATLIGIGGMGLKTAVECMFSACMYGDVKVNDTIISTAGTGLGLDTAVVMRATTPDKCFGKKPSERLDITEILALTIKKQRWG